MPRVLHLFNIFGALTERAMSDYTLGLSRAGFDLTIACESLAPEAPQTSLPAHPHGEAEQCLVLEGSITSDGVTANAGDFTYMPPGSSHHALFSQDGCLLLIAYT